jgi:hypothetical protein
MTDRKQEPVAWWNGKESVVFSHDEIYTPNWTDYWTKPLYTTPPPCPTCESLARTVMLDQTSHDTQRQWVGLTREDMAELRRAGLHSISDKAFEVIANFLKEKNGG